MCVCVCVCRWISTFHLGPDPEIGCAPPPQKKKKFPNLIQFQAGVYVPGQAAALGRQQTPFFFSLRSSFSAGRRDYYLPDNKVGALLGVSLFG